MTTRAQSREPSAPAAVAPEQELARLRFLLETGRALGTEISLDLLMTQIVERASRLMECERSSVFLLDAERGELYSLVAQGLDAREIRIPLASGLAGHVARTGVRLNVPDAYADPRFNREVDHRTGYHTVSVLALPLHDRKGGILGVLQCLNKRGANGTFVPFDASDEEFLAALGGLAAAFLENAKLYRELDQLLEAVVSAFSRAIDDRDPCTSGHTRRVTQLSLNLARAVHACTDPPLDRVVYTRERFRQLRYAALLHDVGKIGVREHVLCKAEKLPAGGIESLRLRLELLRERRRAQALSAAAGERRDPAPLLAAEFDPLAAQIERALELVTTKNQPGFVTDEELTALVELRDRAWLTTREFECLAVRRGTLTPAELADMRSHVSKSHEMLRQIPWPKELREVPEVAYSHHERPDGSGYPRGLQDGAIHLDGQILSIADVYDALIATDRPYKKAVPHEKAKALLLGDAEEGRLMPELVRLFFEKECYRLREEL